MSDDIVEQLRSRANQLAIRFGNMGYYSEADATLDKQAADEIERLRVLLPQAEQKVSLQASPRGLTGRETGGMPPCVQGRHCPS